MTQPTDFIEQLAALAEKATPGPWETIPEVGCENFANSIYAPAGDWDGLLIARVDQNGAAANAALIVLLRNNIDAILALGRERDALRETLGLWLNYDNCDEADFSHAGPMLLYAKAINATRQALEGDNQ